MLCPLQQHHHLLVWPHLVAWLLWKQPFDCHVSVASKYSVRANHKIWSWCISNFSRDPSINDNREESQTTKPSNKLVLTHSKSNFERTLFLRGETDWADWLWKQQQGISCVLMEGLGHFFFAQNQDFDYCFFTSILDRIRRSLLCVCLININDSTLCTKSTFTDTNQQKCTDNRIIGYVFRLLTAI